ncbi:MAG: polyhydroxyalkanoate synthesis repressor PhaR [Acetobacteraceae bacterium]
MSSPEIAVSAEATPETLPVVVKKYANRRLYNTESSSYITLDNLAGMIRVGRDFVVYDARTGEDITRSVLTQIIVEEESKGRAMLPTAFLRQIIGFYGDSLQQFVPSYLEQAMASFALQQEQMRTAVQQTMGNFFPLNIQEVSRQNIAMMERAMSLFTPFRRPAPQDGETAAEPAAADAAPEAAQHATPEEPASEPAPHHEPPAPSGEMEALRHEVESLRAQLAAARATAVAQAVTARTGRPKRDAGAPSAVKERQ